MRPFFAHTTSASPASGFTCDRNPGIRAFLPRMHHARPIELHLLPLAGHAHIGSAQGRDQFSSNGARDARDLAVALIASYQGVALLTNRFRDPDLMARESRWLERWTDSLA
jgi:hypothetical protein